MYKITSFFLLLLNNMLIVIESNQQIEIYKRKYENWVNLCTNNGF